MTAAAEMFPHLPSPLSSLSAVGSHAVRAKDCELQTCFVLTVSRLTVWSNPGVATNQAELVGADTATWDAATLDRTVSALLELARQLNSSSQTLMLKLDSSSQN